MNRVQVGDYTFVSDTKDSKTVTVIGGGLNREMYRDAAVALYKELASANSVRKLSFPERQRWCGTNILRTK